MDYAGFNNCLWRWKTDDGGTQGTDLFICSHGGWDGKRFAKCPAGSEVGFWNYHGQTITAKKCYEIMRVALDANHKRTSICGSGSPVWDYSLSEFPGDWSKAVEEITVAHRNSGLAYDLVVIDDQARVLSVNNANQTVPVYLSDVIAAFPGYARYHLMACRSGG